ncbi:MAG: pitrilysin family protein [Clostridia bacterium]|nr:pitrilysin family protein [Clostridia bacterium]
MKQIYKINNNKFNSMYISINFTMKVNREELSKSALLASVMGKSCKKYKTQTEIETYLSKLYGTNFDVNVQKVGELYNIEFRLEQVNKNYLPNKTDVLENNLKFLYEIIFNPYCHENEFDKETVERERVSLLQKIMSKKDDKTAYAVYRTEQLMSNNQIAGEYLFGDEEIVKNITSLQLYKQYEKLLNDSCITVILSGNLDSYEEIDVTIDDIFRKKLESKYLFNELNINSNKNDKVEELEETSELQETNQSTLTFGMRVLNATQQDFYTLNVYNAILGSTPSSKLFQNVREKESLAYTVKSRFYRFNNIIIIYAGIQKANYEKAKKVIHEQLKQIENGEVTTEEFEAAKQSILADLLEWEDSKIAIAKMLFSNLFAFKSDNVTIQEMCEKISNVTLIDVQDIAKRIKTEHIYLLGGEADV